MSTQIQNKPSPTPKQTQPNQSNVRPKLVNLTEVQERYNSTKVLNEQLAENHIKQLICQPNFKTNPT